MSPLRTSRPPPLGNSHDHIPDGVYPRAVNPDLVMAVRPMGGIVTDCVVFGARRNRVKRRLARSELSVGGLRLLQRVFFPFDLVNLSPQEEPDHGPDDHNRSKLDESIQVCGDDRLNDIGSDEKVEGKQNVDTGIPAHALQRLVADRLESLPHFGDHKLDQALQYPIGENDNNRDVYDLSNQVEDFINAVQINASSEPK